MNLKEVASVRTGLVLSRKKASLYDEIKKTYKKMTLKAFSNSISLIHEHLDQFVANEEIDKGYISRVGDIIIRLRYPIRAVYIDTSTEGMIVPSLMCIVRVINNISLNKEFLAYFLNSTVVKKELQTKIKGTAIQMIRTKDIEDIEIALPPLDEQVKLVEFLKLSQKEIKVLDDLKMQKQYFANSVLDNIIKRSKEVN